MKKVKKNISRYIVRHIIRSLMDSLFSSKLQKLCAKFDLRVDFLQHHYISKLEEFKNLAFLRSQWLIRQSDDMETRKLKKVFRRYCSWFLRTKAARYIINGQMKNKKMYLAYKNDVMLANLRFPKKAFKN